ncbi:DUF305 domain-containing protein [Qipengyuania sp. DGS5-3]|uniref:DUF305 domain-containing protein n=1 Tax=Qipengyuania sp. DGS5-3 TaxID=3349632 RepID=UPI0036D35B05
MKNTSLFALGATLLASTSTAAIAQDAPIVLPGAPGTAGSLLTAEEATDLASTTHSPADVVFMQGMILHHQQAVEMAQLIKDRTNREEIVTIGGRIESGQADEIEFMQGWLRDRGEKAPMVGGEHAGHHGHHGGGEWASLHENMAGMASAEDMARLATLSGVEFDRLFLQLMIAHHEGAIEMVDDLLEQPGSASDPVLFKFANDVDNDQTKEINQMNALLATLSTDPRANLAAGFDNAGEAIWNLRKVASLSKPAGFFDPANPADLKPPKAKDEDEKKAAETTPERGEDDTLTEFAERSPLLDFANTDMAFFDDIMVAGSYHGYNIYRLGDDGAPGLVSSIVCPGGQGDVSVVGDILVMSVEQTRGRVDCGLQGVAEDVSQERFRGLRIFDISDLARPRQVGLVQTCRGSHTHSIVSADDTRIIVYNSGTSRIRDEEELAGCIGGEPGDNRTALFSIDVIEIPLADPSQSRIVKSPRVFADPETGQIAGLWQGGESEEGAQDTRPTDECHDITVFPSKNIAAGACSGNGILFDISDPMNPTRIDAVFDKGFAYWHSATFNNDGTKVIFTDEWGGGGRPRCQASDPMNWGANAIYDIADGKLVFRSHYKMPAPQTDKENCVAHNGSIVPVPGRDLFVQSWYQGGLSIMDFTDSSNPVEVAYFDRGAINKEQLVVGGYWSSYWYNGRIYATEITRGLDVFALEPSEHLTAEEIAAAEAAQYEGDLFNPQTQTEVTWPDDVVARAFESRPVGTNKGG